MKKILLFFIVNNLYSLTSHFPVFKVPKNLLDKPLFKFSNNKKDSLSKTNAASVDDEILSNKDNQIDSIAQSVSKYLQDQDVIKENSYLEQTKDINFQNNVVDQTEDDDYSEDEFFDALDSLEDFEKIKKIDNSKVDIKENKVIHPLERLRLELSDISSYKKNKKKKFIEDILMCVDILKIAKDAYYIDLAQQLLQILMELGEDDYFKSESGQNICDLILRSRKGFVPRQKYWYEPLWYYEILIEKQRLQFNESKNDLIHSVNKLKDTYGIF